MSCPCNLQIINLCLVPDPKPAAGTILVKIHSFGLNRMDIMQREDRYPYPLLPESGTIMGVEFSGVVEGKGADCKCLVSKLPAWRHTDP